MSEPQLFFKLPFTSPLFQRCYSLWLLMARSQNVIKNMEMCFKSFCFMRKYKIYTFNPHIIKIKYVQEEGSILCETGVCSRHLI